MASIGKRTWSGPDGKPVTAYQVRWKHRDGKIKRKQFDKRKDADEWRRKVEPLEPKRTQMTGCFTDAKTVGDALEEYLRAIHDGVDGRSPLDASTQQTYANYVATHLEPMFGNLTLESLNPSFCRELRDRLLAKVPTRGYARNVWGIFQRAINLMVLRGALPQDPTRGVTIHRDESSKVDKIKMPTIDEAKRMIAYAEEQARSRDRRRRLAWTKWSVMLKFGFETGFRIGEIIALPWSCVDLDNRTVEVKQTAKRGSLGIGKPKTKNGYRVVGISKEMQELLAAWKEKCPKSQNDLVFPGVRGGTLFYSVVRENMWNPMIVALGMRDNGEYRYSPHCMRHFRASVSIAAGANPLKLSRELGHSSVQITYDTYGHLMKEDADKFAENASHVQRLLTG